MANLSDADVTISGEKVGKELLAYIRATQKTPTDYAIIYDEFDPDVVDEEGNIDLHSSSSGRWAYENNLEGYFSPDRVKQWLGVGAKFEYVKEELREAYAVQANEQYNAYVKLVNAIKRKGGSVTIDYTDSDAGMEWMSEGSASLQLNDDGEVEYIHNSSNVEWTIANFAQQQYEDEVWALGYMYGEELIDEYEKSENKGESVDDWYNNIRKEV